MIVKKKLRDVTFDEFAKWRAKNCCYCIKCSDCIFENVNCSRYKMHSWTNDKNIFSDDFLNLEIEVEQVDILDDVEKRYLKAIIKPFNKVFKNRVKYICKVSTINNHNVVYKIKIVVDNIFSDVQGEEIILPCFKRESNMYSGMELNKCYTLKELGLDYKRLGE